jgi:hypothetical protein
MSKNQHRGGDFRDLLKDEGILAEVEIRALKQAMSLKLTQLLKSRQSPRAKWRRG